MPAAMNEVICACLTRVYADHATRTDRLTCKLEHALPIRQSFFRLKRVPHFQTRDDLHTDHTPAYHPIYRLENASLESLSQKTKAGCRRVLVEGDLGTGKTLVCQKLLHEWAKAMQFFRNVKIDQPHITVGFANDPTPFVKEGSSSTSKNHSQKSRIEEQNNACVDTLSTISPDDQCKKREWNVEMTGSGKEVFISKTNESMDAFLIASREKITQSKRHDVNRTTEKIIRETDCSPKEGPTTTKSETEEGAMDKENYIREDRRSRKSLFDEGILFEEMPKKRRSRSRSTGEAEIEYRNRKRERGKYDGIPQKYLSLLNIASPGEGSFESPGLSRSRTIREPRRQRPSRLTSNLTDYKAMIYVPCVRLALSEILSKCNNARVRHYFMAASVLLDLLTLSDMPHHPLSFDAVYHWVLANRDDICIIFDNLDGSEAWERLISDAFHDRDGFGKIIVAATPGRISKRDVDSLFYCYGLSPEYSSRILLSRLRTEAPNVVERISFLLDSNHTQELLCNPLSLSLLSAYFRSVKETDTIPEHLSELLENLIQNAMAQEANKVQNISSKSRRRKFSLQNVCETVAFECLENDTNYFSKQKFPQQFWTRHLCDCRVLHEVHEIANFGAIYDRPPSPAVINPCITPDSDSVHSSASSTFEPNNFSDVSSSNQSLASADYDWGPGSKSEDNAYTDYITQGSGSLLQVPMLKNTNEITKKPNERPKSLSIECKKSSSPRQSVNQTSQTSGEIVSFTSRCIRDFLASNRVCRYLQSDRDSESFIQRLITKPQFYPVLRLTVRSLYLSERSDLILNLLDMLLTSQEMSSGQPFSIQTPSPPRTVSPISVMDPPIRVRIPHRYRVSNSDCPFRAKREEQKQRRSSTSILGTCFEGSPVLVTSSSFNRLLVNTSTLSPYPHPQTEPTRGYLEDFKEALIWLAETDNSEPYIGAVSNRFPDTLVISYQDCPSETIEHFTCLTKRSSPSVKEVVLYMSGFYAQWDLGILLAEALQELKKLSLIKISMKCVVETSFLVDFICECFENNDHTKTLWLEGPMNVAENLSPCEHRRVQRVFGNPSLKLKELILDHFSYHHRINYILNSWPDVLETLQFKKCNIDNVSTTINEKLSKCPKLTSLSIENCFAPSQTLFKITQYIYKNISSIRLVSLEMTMLSSSRKVTKVDAQKSYFKSSVNLEICHLLANFVARSVSLKQLILSYDGLSNEHVRPLFQSAVDSKTLVTLDFSGNLIDNEIEDDVILLLKKATQLTYLLLGDNNITKSAKSTIIRESLSRHDLRLSL